MAILAKGLTNMELKQFALAKMNKNVLYRWEKNTTVENSNQCR